MKIVLMSLLFVTNSFAINLAPRAGGDVANVSGSRKCLRGYDSAAAGKFYDETAGLYPRMRADRLFGSGLGIPMGTKAQFRDAVASDNFEAYIRGRITSVASFSKTLCEYKIGQDSKSDDMRILTASLGACSNEAQSVERQISVVYNTERAIELSKTHSDQFLQAIDSSSRSTFVNNAMAGTGEGCQ